MNNFSPSKTRTELLQRVKSAGVPHHSYDLVSRDPPDTYPQELLYSYYHKHIHFNVHTKVLLDCLSSLLSCVCVQDGDGYVSQEDYRLAKRFDFDGES